MNGNTLTGIIGVLLGILCIIGAWLKWSIIMNPAKLLPRLLGEMTARIVYVMIGLIMNGIGIGLICGWIGGQP